MGNGLRDICNNFYCEMETGLILVGVDDDVSYNGKGRHTWRSIGLLFVQF